MARKKILVTGLNKNQTHRDYFLKQELKVVPSHYALVRALEDMGYDVEQRVVTIGEDLSHYDDVLVYVHSPKAFCQFLWSGLWAIHARPDCIMAFDDWQIDQIIYSIKSYRDYFLQGDLEKAYKDYYFDLWQGKESKEEVSKYSEAYLSACDQVLKKSNRLLISAFAGGDIRLLKTGWDESRIVTFNPNPYHLNRTPENNWGVEKVTTFDDLFADEQASEKKLEWNFASLVQKKTRKWVDSQGVSAWPITYYGSKRNEEKCERLTEDQMCKKFHEQWGILMPGYFHSGSGWWRARPLQVADAGSVLVGDKKELALYYGDTSLIKTAREVEAMSVSDLTDLARAQRDAIYRVHPLSKDVTQSEIRKALDADR